MLNVLQSWLLTGKWSWHKLVVMPRHLRIEHPGAVYHPPAFGFGATSVMNHGDGRVPTLHVDPFTHTNGRP
jgi:hypothetical protein